MIKQEDIGDTLQLMMSNSILVVIVKDTVLLIPDFVNSVMMPQGTLIGKW